VDTGLSHQVRWESAEPLSAAVGCVMSCAVLLLVPFSRGMLRPCSWTIGMRSYEVHMPLSRPHSGESLVPGPKPTSLQRVKAPAAAPPGGADVMRRRLGLGLAQSCAAWQATGAHTKRGKW
jgi:hypothetical protein